MVRLRTFSLSVFTWSSILSVVHGCATAEIDPNAELYVNPDEELFTRELPPSRAMGGALPVVIPVVQPQEPTASPGDPIEEGCSSEPCFLPEPVEEPQPLEPSEESLAPQPVNLVMNGDFVSGASHWNAHDAEFVAREVVVVDGMGCTNSGGLGWSGSSGGGINLDEGTYVLSLRLKATSSPSVELKISRAIDPWEPVVFSETLAGLSVSDESYRFEFTLNRELSNMGFLLSVDGGQVCIDDLSIAPKP